VRSPHIHLRQSKIGQFDMPIDVQQNVLGLQVPINDLRSVQIVQPQRNLSKVEPRLALSKPPQVVHVEEQLTARAEVE
jgi:hypothetical protein